MRILQAQSTGGRRAALSVLLGGALAAGPLLLLHTGSHAVQRRAAPDRARPGAVALARDARVLADPAWELLGDTAAGSRPTAASAAVPAATPTGVAASPPSTTTTTTAPPPPTTTTTTVAPPPPPPPAPPAVPVVHQPAPAPAPASAGSATGVATWYAAASPGHCASPTLAFGTVLTVTARSGARITCTVDDREGANPGRVVDLSPADFSRLADLSQGVVEVTITW